jgi:hypothetical protein
MKIQEPEWIITTTDESLSRPVDFKELFGLKSTIVTAMLLWDTNSYYVNVSEGFFVINGGRTISVPKNIGSDPVFLYTRRVSQAFSAFEGEVKSTKKDTTYLFGVESVSDSGTKLEIFLTISQDGRFWRWGNKR